MKVSSYSREKLAEMPLRKFRKLYQGLPIYLELKRLRRKEQKRVNTQIRRLNEQKGKLKKEKDLLTRQVEQLRRSM